MSEPKLKAKLFVHAALRICAVQAIPAVVVKKGDEDAGTVLVKLNRADLGCCVYTQVRDSEGRLAWLCTTGATPVSEAEADSRIARAREVDWDMWVIEVEDRAGRVPFLDRILPAKG